MIAKDLPLINGKSFAKGKSFAIIGPAVLRFNAANPDKSDMHWTDGSPAEPGLADFLAIMAQAAALPGHFGQNGRR